MRDESGSELRHQGTGRRRLIVVLKRAFLYLGAGYAFIDVSIAFNLAASLLLATGVLGDRPERRNWRALTGLSAVLIALVLLVGWRLREVSDPWSLSIIPPLVCELAASLMLAVAVFGRQPERRSWRVISTLLMPWSQRWPWWPPSQVRRVSAITGNAHGGKPQVEVDGECC